MPQQALPSTPIYRFSRYDKIVIGGIVYRSHDWDTNGHRFRRDADPDTTEIFSHEEICTRFQSGTITLDRNFFLATEAAARSHAGKVLLSDLPEHEQRTIFLRKEYCDRFLRAAARDRRVTRSDASLERVLPQITDDIYRVEIDRQKRGRCGTEITLHEEARPSQFRRWLRRYEAAGFNPLALRDRYRRSGNRKPKVDGDSMLFARAYALKYMASGKPSRAMVFREYETAIDPENVIRQLEGKSPLDKVSQRTFEKLINRLDPFRVSVARDGLEAAKAQFAIVNDGLDVTRPLERVEMDEWNVSLQTLLVEAGAWARLTPEQRALVARTDRAYLTAIIDCAAKCILALRLHLAAPSATSAISALEMMTMDKTYLSSVAGAISPWDMYGSPETVAMDAGPAFIAVATRAVVLDLGAEALFPPAGLASMRANIERLFGNFQQHFIRYFPGQTFENVIAKGNYDSEGNACVMVDTLNETLVRYVIDAYHNSPHDGLVGETPRNAWLRLTKKFPILPPPDAAKRRHIFGLMCERRIGSRGIRLLGLHYQSPELQILRRAVGQTLVMIKVDRFDLGQISVRVNDTWLSVEYRHQGIDMKGVSYWEWMAAVQSLRRHNADMSALSVSVVQTALASVRDTAEMARQRAELGSPILTAEDFEKADYQLSKAFAFVDDGGTADPEDLLGEDDWGDATSAPQNTGAEAQPPPHAIPPTHPTSTSADDFGDAEDWLTDED